MQATKPALVAHTHWDSSVHVLIPKYLVKEVCFGSARVRERSLLLRKAKHFIGQFMATDDSFKPLWVRSAVTEQVGGFQIPGVCLQAFPSLLSPSTRLSCFSLAPTFAWLKHRNLPRKRLLRRLLHRLHWHSQDLQPLKIRFLLPYPSQRIDFKIRTIHAVYAYSYVAVRWQHLI